MKSKRVRKKVESWLKENKGYINITGFEKSIYAPKGLIHKWIKYDKKIHDDWIDPIDQEIKKVTTYKIK